MVTNTKRDRVWNAALELAENRETFALDDVYATCDATDLSDRTMRDVLTTMAELDWIEKRVDPTDGRRQYARGRKFVEDEQT